MREARDDRRAARRPSRRPAALAGVLLASLALAACQPAVRTAPKAGPPPPGPLFERAFVVRADVDVAAACEATLARVYDVQPSGGEPWFTILTGTSTVLVVATHATAQTREGDHKAADTGTGSLAVMLNALVRTPAIYTTRKSPSDPNYYDDNDFKRALARLVAERRPALVLDLHASDGRRPYDVDFGTMRGASLLGSPDYLARLATALGKEGLNNLSQDYFAAARAETVAKFVARLGVPAIQLEINANWLLGRGIRGGEVPDIRQQRFAQLLQGLVRFVAAVDRVTLPDRSDRDALRADAGDPCLLGRP